MNSLIVKTLVLVTALSIALPESYAKRVGSSRSTGRQSRMVERPAPPPSAPSAAPSTVPPAAVSQQPPVASPAPVQRPQQPAPAPARQASPWGGMLGGALLGLGLGSLLSRGDRVQQNPASGTDNPNGPGANAPQTVNEDSGSGLRTLLWLGLLAAVGIFLIRIIRRRRY